MKRLFAIFGVLIIVSCGDHNVAVVDNKRMLVSGNILDTENAPLEEINITSSGSEHGHVLFARPKEVLGEGFTNASGEFSFVSLDTDNSFYGISINHPNQQGYREEFASIHFLDSIVSRGNSFELVNIQLPKTQEYQVNIRNASDRNDTLFFEFSYPPTELYTKLDEDSIYFQTESGYGDRVLPREDEMVNYSFRTIENGSVQFQYKFSAEAVYDTIHVEITPENPVYEFYY